MMASAAAVDEELWEQKEQAQEQKHQPQQDRGQDHGLDNGLDHDNDQPLQRHAFGYTPPGHHRHIDEDDADDDQDDEDDDDEACSDTGSESPSSSDAQVFSHTSSVGRDCNSPTPSSVYSYGQLHDRDRDPAVEPYDGADKPGLGLVEEDRNAAGGVKVLNPGAGIGAGAGDATVGVAASQTVVTSSDATRPQSRPPQPQNHHHHQETQSQLHHHRQFSLASQERPSTPRRRDTDTDPGEPRARTPSIAATVTTPNQNRFSIRRKPLSPTSPVVRAGIYPEFQPFPVPETPARRGDEARLEKTKPEAKGGDGALSSLELGPLIAEFPTPPRDSPGRAAPEQPNPDRADARPDLVVEHFSEHGDEDPDVGVHGSISNYTATTHDDAASYYAQEKIATPAKLTVIKRAPPHLDLRNISSPPAAPSLASPHSPSKSPRLNKPLPAAPSPNSPSALPRLFSWVGSLSPSPALTEFSTYDDSSFTAKGAALTDASPISTTLGSATSNAFPTDAPRNQYLNKSNTHFADTPLSPGPLSPGLTTPGFPVPAAVQIEEMEDELKGISSELAASIRREMDLEDLVERLQAERESFQPGRRTSDYFSDSGASSGTKPGAAASENHEHRPTRDEVDRIQRRAEQDLAKLRLELGNKLQEERNRRTALDMQVQELSARAARIDLAQVAGTDATGRVRELERACDDLRRKLAQEREANANCEDLLADMRCTLEETVNERDNLRDEVVPGLHARLEGLESEAAKYVTLTYESTKMQQELQSLREENGKLNGRVAAAVDAAAAAAAAQKSQAQRPTPPPLQRSNSTMDARTRTRKPVAALDLARAGTPPRVESRDALAERLKDVEGQRDALHAALKSLLERQDFQNRENDKKIKALEVERDRLLASSPRAAGFEKEVANLKAEIKMLRRRAQEAIDQKWQVEKGLGGLKMDLDRAEQEIQALRKLLQDANVPVPARLSHVRSASGSSGAGSRAALPVPVISGSLAKAYQDVQATYADALGRIRQLEADGTSLKGGDAPQLAMRRLQKALESVVTERDEAVAEAEALKGKIEELEAAAGDVAHLEGERALADELEASARRVEGLAAQVRQQLATNATLRDRLASTVARGDSDRKSNVERINSLQNRMRVLEDALVAAQNAAEDRAARHEAEVAAMRDAHSALRRSCTCPATGGGAINHSHNIHVLSGSFSRSASRRATALLEPTLSPRFPPASPRFAPPRARSANAGDDEEDDSGAVMMLRSRVAELEALLNEAEGAMQEVIAKMSEAQIEVMTLRDEKEEAMRETRKLQRQLEDEAAKSFDERFRSLAGLVR